MTIYPWYINHGISTRVLCVVHNNLSVKYPLCLNKLFSVSVYINHGILNMVYQVQLGPRYEGQLNPHGGAYPP